MKILHTSDWHLGAKLEGFSRLSEQEKTLDEIVRIADEELVDIVIIAGDVFNSKTPSSETEDLFFKALSKLSDNSNRLIFVLSGNHDDPLRLSASRPLAQKYNIVFATGLDPISVTQTNLNAKTRIIDSGFGFIKVKHGDEYAVISYLPFIAPNSLMELAKTEDYNEGVKLLSTRASEAFNQDSLNIFVSHLFLKGGAVNQSGETLGGANEVSAQNLPRNAHYIALGHLHSAQKIGDNCYYSGSITELRTKDARPQVNIITGDKTGVLDNKNIKLKSAVRVKEIVADNVALAYKLVSEEDRNDYIYLTIKHFDALKSTFVRELRRDFPNIVSLKLITDRDQEIESEFVDFKKMGLKELFVEFCKYQTGSEPSKELVDLFMKCGGEDYDSFETDDWWNK